MCLLYMIRNGNELCIILLELWEICRLNINHSKEKMPMMKSCLEEKDLVGGGPYLPSFIPEVAGSHCHGWEFHSSSLSHYPNKLYTLFMGWVGGFAFRFWILYHNANMVLVLRWLSLEEKGECLIRVLDMSEQNQDLPELSSSTFFYTRTSKEG